MTAYNNAAKIGISDQTPEWPDTILYTNAVIYLHLCASDCTRRDKKKYDHL